MWWWRNAWITYDTTGRIREQLMGQVTPWICGIVRETTNLQDYEEPLVSWSSLEHVVLWNEGLMPEQLLMMKWIGLEESWLLCCCCSLRVPVILEMAASTMLFRSDEVGYIWRGDEILSCWCSSRLLLVLNWRWSLTRYYSPYEGVVGIVKLAASVPTRQHAAHASVVAVLLTPILE